MSDSWLLSLQPITLQASRLKEYCVWGSNMVTLYVKELLLADVNSSLVMLVMSKGLLLAATLRAYKRYHTGKFPSKV